jgi:hypothetical protein
VRGPGTLKVAIVVLGSLLLFGIFMTHRSSGATEASFKPAEGWTSTRVVALGLEIDAHVGRLPGVAACAAKAVAANTTWSDWIALTPASHATIIRRAEEGC